MPKYKDAGLKEFTEKAEADITFLNQCCDYQSELVLVEEVKDE